MTNAIKLVFATALALTLSACNETKPNPVAPPVVGGDRDAHGCIGSAGYTWCQATNQCERSWELAKQHQFELTPEAFDTFCQNKK
ncbi:hypothetical protein [Thiothrix fructosivorans]|uniref:Peptidase n=1 Tax=Thiothrix fructosivorans TaxID=111770 RepID=A0A8B0SL09_9GAMM|nr:hypothetical protein [Thiothrix fructosivorans]MBO0612794.1 hypothetical protein [Thiothrix fructosivorans]QTX11745.1 hypothetical protein J1836_005205 [Thiothrix fructosivorans]